VLSASTGTSRWSVVGHIKEYILLPGSSFLDGVQLGDSWFIQAQVDELGIWTCPIS